MAETMQVAPGTDESGIAVATSNGMAHFDVPSRLFMSSPVHTVAPHEVLDVVDKSLRQHRISSLAVVEGEKLVGVVSRTDLLKIARRDAGLLPDADNLTLPAKPVSEIMHSDVETLDVDAPVSEAAKRMVKKSFHRVFLTEGDSLKGVLSTRDVMIAIRDKRVKIPISEFMSSPLFTVRGGEPISLATERLAKARISGLVVVDGDWPVGLFTQVDALAAQKMPRDTRTEDAMNTAFVCMPFETPIHRAAAQAATLRVRRIVAVRRREMVGIMTGLDFARCAAG